MGKSNKEIKEKLNYLSGLEETDYPFITLYMNINAHEFLEQAEKNRIFLKNAIQGAFDFIKKEGDSEKANSFKNNIRRIKYYIENELKTKSHGLAIFACEHLGVFEVFESVMPFENEFIMNSSPHLKQLAYQAEEFESALALMVDSKYAKIFDLSIRGGLNQKGSTENLVHRFHKQGGWSQMRYQRHIEKQVEEHFIETSKELTKIADEENFDNIILIGQEHEIKNFQKHLPDRINNKVINIDSMQMNENPNLVMEKVVDDIYEKEKNKEFETINDIIGKAQQNDSATIGVQDVIELAKEGRIHMLAVNKELSMPGYKCGDCLYTSKFQHKAGCPECNGNLQKADLIEETIRLTIKNGGEVELIDEETPAAQELQKHEGIGAYLRY